MFTINDGVNNSMKILFCRVLGFHKDNRKSESPSHWRSFQFCQAYTWTIQKNRVSHWSCMVANERSADQFWEPNWQDLANKMYLICCNPFGGWQEEAHEHSDAILLVGTKDNVLYRGYKWYSVTSIRNSIYDFGKVYKR